MKQKGSEKTGGRAKGTPNKVTTDLRKWVRDVILNNQVAFEADLQALAPDKRIDVIEKLLKYAVPPIKSRGEYFDLSGADMPFGF